MNAFWGWLILIGVVAFFVVGVADQMKKLKAQAQRDAEMGVVARFGDLAVTATELIEGEGPTERRHPVNGLIAQVEDSGTLNRRITATRMVTLGVFALAAPKKLDDRMLYLSVEGPETGLVREVKLANNAAAGVKAREFVQQVNRLAAAPAPAARSDAEEAAPGESPAPPLPSSPPPFTSNSATDAAEPLVGRTGPPAPIATPGWYPDGRGALRWFDGYGWTDDVRAKPSDPPPPAENETSG